MKKHYSWLNAHEKTANRLNQMPSVTIPSQTLSVRQILDRYRRGMPLEGRRQPLYHDGEFPDINGLDLSEIQALKRAAAEQVQQYQADLAKQEEANRKQKEQQLNEEIEKLKKQLNDSKKGQDSLGTIRPDSPSL